MNYRDSGATAKQLAFISKLCEELELDEDELYVKNGWYELSPWGLRTANEKITKVSASVTIKRLLKIKRQREARNV